MTGHNPRERCNLAAAILDKWLKDIGSVGRQKDSHTNLAIGGLQDEMRSILIYRLQHQTYRRQKRLRASVLHSTTRFKKFLGEYAPE